MVYNDSTNLLHANLLQGISTLHSLAYIDNANLL